MARDLSFGAKSRWKLLTNNDDRPAEMAAAVSNGVDDKWSCSQVVISGRVPHTRRNTISVCDTDRQPLG